MSNPRMSMYIVVVGFLLLVVIGRDQAEGTKPGDARASAVPQVGVEASLGTGFTYIVKVSLAASPPRFRRDLWRTDRTGATKPHIAGSIRRNPAVVAKGGKKQLAVRSIAPRAPTRHPIFA